MEQLLQLGKEEAIKRLAAHEQAGTLLEYISEIAPEYIDCGVVLKFLLLNDLGWL